MCYGMRCIYENPYTGECTKPRNVPCPMEEDDEIVMEELAHQVKDTLVSFALTEHGQGLTAQEIYDYLCSIDEDELYEVVSQFMTIPDEVSIYDLIDKALDLLEKEV